MYIDAICDRLDEIPESRHIRSKIISNFKNKGIEWLRNEIKKYDKNYYTKVDKNNHQRMIRALEVYKISGKSDIYIQNDHKSQKMMLAVLI